MKIYKTKRRLLRSGTKAVSVLLTGSIAVTLLCGCSFDNPWDESVEGGGKVFNVDEAYLAVTLTSAGIPQTTALTSNPADETKVSNAYFYMYDSDGVFVVQGSITPSGWSEDTSTGEISSSNIILLSGLTGKNFPNYVVTVLNKPDDFDYTPYLEDMLSKLSTETTGTSSGIYDSNNRFIMTTSTYPGAGGNDDKNKDYYFVTQIDDSDFHLGTVSNMKSDDIETSLRIYVQRLAAKVTVVVGEEMTSSADDYIEIGEDEAKRTLYKLPNEVKVNGEDEEVYVELLGWKLNGTARNSYMFKHIDTSWNTDTPWTGWYDYDGANVSDDKYSPYYCEWGQSYNYGKTDSDYPSSPNGNTWSDETNESSGNWLNQYLRYVNLKDDEAGGSSLIEIGSSDYCAENTNTAGDGKVIDDPMSSAVTGVLIKAQICDEKGETVTGVLGYSKGLMYYYAPIEHVNYVDDDALNEGEYGVVRNYQYLLTINELYDLGTPINDEDDSDPTNDPEVIIPGSLRTAGFTSVALPWIINEEDVDTGRDLDKDSDGKGYIDITK